MPTLRTSLLLAALLFGCAAPDVPPELGSSEAEIGPEGGSLTLPGARLDIPPGALTEPVRIALRAYVPEAAPDFEPTSDVLLELSPSGLTFARPARLSLSTTATDSRIVKLIERPSPEGGPPVMFLRPFESSYDAATGMVSADIEGFSRYVAGVVPAGPPRAPIVEHASWDACRRQLAVGWTSSETSRVLVERGHRSGGATAPVTWEWAWELPATFDIEVGARPAPARDQLAHTYVFRLYALRDARGTRVLGPPAEAILPAIEIIAPAELSSFQAREVEGTVWLTWHDAALRSAPEQPRWTSFEILRSPAWPEGDTLTVTPDALTSVPDGASVHTLFVDRAPLPTATYWLRGVHVPTGCEARTTRSPWLVASLGSAPTAPEPLLGLSATALDEARVDLRWATAERATEYVVERSAGGAFTEVAVVSYPSAGHIDEGLSAETTYRYRVTPRNPAGTGTPAEVEVTTPSAVTSGTRTCGDLRVTVAPPRRSIVLQPDMRDPAYPDAVFDVEIERSSGGAPVRLRATSTVWQFEELSLYQLGRDVLDAGAPMESTTLTVRAPSYAFRGTPLPFVMPITVHATLGDATPCTVDVELEVLNPRDF